MENIPAPPPLPPEEKPFARQAALLGLLLPVAAIAITAALRSAARTTPMSPNVNLVLMGMVGLIIIAGLIMAIVGLTGGTVGRGVAGLVINGLLLCPIAVN